MSSMTLKGLLVDCLKSAGRVLLEHAAAFGPVMQKENQSSIVTAADLASERIICNRLRTALPDHGFLGEETGFQPGATDWVWVVDPLDGTSNYAAGLPWYGVLIAVLKAGVPVLGGLYLPVSGTLYLGEADQGVHRNGCRVSVTSETDLRNILCAFALDAAPEETQARREAALLMRLANRIRNVRATNCLLDFAYTIDGRFGGCINFNTHIWDIAAPLLLLQEAGGVLTELDGTPLKFQLDEQASERSFAVLGASRTLHPLLLKVLQGGSREG